MRKIKYIPPDKNNQRRNIAVTEVTTIEQAKEVILLTEGKPEVSGITQHNINICHKKGKFIMYDDHSNNFMWFWYSTPTSNHVYYTYDEFIQACIKPKLSFLNIEDNL